MKAIDIATKNHVTIDDLKEVCKNLDIQCENGDTDFSEQHIFLVQKKIESLKAKKVQKIESSKKGTKIKLKRKVHVSKEIKQKQSTESDQSEKAKTAVDSEKKAVTKPRAGESSSEKKPARVDDSQRKSRPPQGGDKSRQPGTRPAAGQRPTGGSGQRPTGGSGQRPTGGSGQRPTGGGRPGGSGQRPTGGGRPGGRPGDGSVSPVAAELGDNKRKKSATPGGKEKDKNKYKKENEEKVLAFNKKQQQAQAREIKTPDEISITENITVNYLVNGSATPNDYVASPLLSSYVSFKPENPSQQILITPVDDDIYEGNEDIIITLLDGNTYEIVGQINANVIIEDNDYP
ncbi:MAG: hypothetical protein PF450_12015, partial [Bacteroidales bacterium]|nr:hypothetical protein [Bacteroidales bacterium]